MPPSQSAALSSGYNIFNVRSAANPAFAMDTSKPPFNDVRVRQAFNYAINKEKLLALLNGRGVVARGVLPPGLPGYAPGLKGYPYDPDKARRLLEDAGVPKDFAPVLWMRADQTMLILAQSIQQDLALVGVNVLLKPVAWGPLLEAIREPRNLQLFMLAWRRIFRIRKTFWRCSSPKANGVPTTTLSSTIPRLTG